MSIYADPDKDILMSCHNKIRPYVRELLDDGYVGLCCGKVKITSVKSSLSHVTRQSNCDRLTICLPVAGQTLFWEILFDATYPEESPDFIFGPDDEEFYPSIEDVKSLRCWDPSNPAALMLAIRELLEMYQAYQRELILANPRLQFEYTSLVDGDDSPFNQENIELLTYKKPDGSLGPVYFLIDLHIDFSLIPAYLTKDKPGADTAVLLINFPSASKSKVIPQLYLSPRVDRCLGGSSNVRIPPFTAGTCLLDYVPGVKILLEDKIKQIETIYEQKREYISAFLSHFGRSIIQYDAETFSHMSFLFEWNDFFFITSIHMTDKFPWEQPSIRFQSIYHSQESNERPYSQTFTDYPYSPRWSGNEMAERTRTFILDNVKSFQITSITKGRF